MSRNRLLLLLKPFDLYPARQPKALSQLTNPKILQVFNYLDNRRTVHKEAIVSCQNILRNKCVDWEPIFRSSLSQPIRDVDLIITIGGDGTLLQASHFVDDSIPVLGVNSDPTQVEEVEECNNEFDATRRTGYLCAAAAIVMRTVRNIVNTGRTIVCTIHQPSVDIFESFDELVFMKRGGELIYAGPLGPKYCKLINYFEAIEGVTKIKPGHNPATWMLEVTSSTEDTRLGVDFAEIYRRSNLYQRNRELVERLNKPTSEAKDLNFPTKYSRLFFAQFLACLWK